jgi:hypothetical protein
MRTWLTLSSRLIVAILGLLAPITQASAMADPALAYETVEPSRIKLGETATIRVTSLDGYLENIKLPTVPGLTFEIIGRMQGLEFVAGKSIPASYIMIRVTPQFVGVFSIPGLTPKSATVGLEVYTGDAPNPYAWRSQKPAATPPPMSKAPIPKGIQLRAGGAAFVQLVIPTRPVYVGESVPIDIELGLRPGIVTSLNGPPALTGNDFTLNNLSKEPLRRNQVIEGSPFLVMTWHTALAAVKPGDFSLAVQTPLSVKVNTRSAEDQAFAAQLGWPFSQIPYNGVAPKDVTIESPSLQLKVLSLPKEGRPNDFSGAVGEFQVSSDTSATHVAAGDPVTLRLHVSGVGNFDRVDAAMFDHLDHWKTYPAKSTFTPSDPAGDKGEKVFEQPLIAAQAGEESIPALEFSYFNPTTQRYERAQTLPIKVIVGSSLADSSLGAPAGGAAQGTNGLLASQSARGLRPDHPEPRSSVSQLRPLYFQATFLAVPAALALILAGSLFAVRPHPARVTSKAAQRALAQLEAAARSGDAGAFFGMARNVLLQTFSARWTLPAEQISSDELKTRLGAAAADVERLFALADEAKYSGYEAGSTDFQRWLEVIRGQLLGERA